MDSDKIDSPNLDATVLVTTKWNEAPFLPTDQGISVLKTAQLLFISSLTSILTFFAIFSVKNISMHYMRDYDDDTMVSAIGIGFTIMNIFSILVFVALNIGLLEKMSDAYDAEAFELVGLHLQRGLIINVFAMIPCFITLCLSDQICLLIGFDSQISSNVQNFIVLCLPGVFCMMIFTTLTSYINACNKFSAPQLIQVASAVVFWVTAHVLTEHVGWGTEGIAFSFNLMYVTALISLIAYLAVKNPAPGTIFWLRKESFRGTIKLFFHQVSTGWNVFIQWVAFEIIFLFCGALNNGEILGLTIAYNNLAILYIIPIAFSDTMLTYMVDSLQQRDALKARKFFKVGILINLLMMLLLLAIYFVFINQIAAIYTNDTDQINLTVNIMKAYSLILLPEFVQLPLQSGLRIIGKENTGISIYNFCAYFLAMPVAYCLCYVVGLRVYGLVLGPVLSLYFVTIGLIYIYWKNKWSDQIQIIAGDKLHEDLITTIDYNEKEESDISLYGVL